MPLPYLLPFILGPTVDATNTVGIADYVVRSMGVVRFVTDAVGISDSVVKQQKWTRLPVNTVGVQDSLWLARAYAKSDAVGISDSGLIELASRFDAVRTDGIGALDSLVVVKRIERYWTDNVGIKDRLIHIIGSNHVDIVGISDGFFVEFTPYGLLRTDALGLVDSAKTASSSLRQPKDVVGVSDMLIASMDEKILSDKVGLRDMFYFGIPGVPETDNTWIIPAESITAAIKPESVVHVMQAESVVTKAREGRRDGVE